MIDPLDQGDFHEPWDHVSTLVWRWFVGDKIERQNKKQLIKSDMKLGPQPHISAESQYSLTIKLVPKSWKMVTNIGGT